MGEDENFEGRKKRCMIGLMLEGQGLRDREKDREEHDKWHFPGKAPDLERGVVPKGTTK